MKPRRKGKIQEDTVPLYTTKGQCIIFKTKNANKWYDVLTKYYYESTSEEENGRDCNWNDKKDKKGQLVETAIKYSDKQLNFSATITIYQKNRYNMHPRAVIKMLVRRSLSDIKKAI